MSEEMKQGEKAAFALGLWFGGITASVAIAVLSVLFGLVSLLAKVVPHG